MHQRCERCKGVGQSSMENINELFIYRLVYQSVSRKSLNHVIGRIAIDLLVDRAVELLKLILHTIMFLK